MRPQALGLYTCSSFMVSENTSPMISTSISGVASTRTANFLMRLFGAITASVMGGSRQSSLPTDPPSPVPQGGPGRDQCVSFDTGLFNVYGFGIVRVLQILKRVATLLPGQDGIKSLSWNENVTSAMSLRAERSNLLCRGSRLLRRCAPRNDRTEIQSVRRAQDTM